jgi:Polyketide cyclase / dehydrase and lipid transport
MPHGAISQIIPANCVAVFDLVHDYDRRLEWDTLLSSASLVDGATRAELGATTLCVGRGWLGMIGMKAKYVAFDRPRLTAVKMVNSPPFFASCGASIRHDEVGADESRITYTWTFTARPRWLAWLLEPVMQRVFAWETKKRLAALREYFESQRLRVTASTAKKSTPLPAPIANCPLQNAN